MGWYVKHEWSVRVRTDSAGGCTASARNHSLKIGEPLSFAPKDELPCAIEMAVGALAADLLGSLRRVCRLRRVNFERAEISLRFTLDNALTYIGVIGEEGSPAIAEIDGAIYVSAFDEDAIRDAWEEALRRSPLFNTLNKAAAITLRLNVTP